ncbi:MAG: DUF4080 domain-containing protein [Verrucomicrobiales bacterium]|nr:DUF4080 domain-containing protein [Verrucomicrobiales bacterium]
MPDIVLATLNAKYIHSAFGLRYLLANLGELRSQATLLEFDIHQRPVEIVERILAVRPRLVGFGVYIWNVAETRRVVALLKRLRPDVVVVLGGPEVSHELGEQEIARLADYVIPGEAEIAFRDLSRQVLAGAPPEGKVRPALLPALDRLELPYDLYSDDDLAHRILYVEASRGCPFECEFCLSSLDEAVRRFPLERFLAAMDRLLERGARHFKFVDRTFNLNLRVGQAILDFFHARLCPELFLHFELVPDRLPEGLRDRIRRFPAGTLQFEVGIQTFNPEVAARISRRQDYTAAAANLRFLREETGGHIHADLIFGLPGEDLESFAAGFDRLIGLRPHEIQVGMLKRLRGTPISRHDREWEVIWSPDPPYEILSNRLLDFAALQGLRRFARFWDLVANSGHFGATTPRLWEGTTPFAGFRRFSEWLHAQTGRTHAIALPRLVELLFRYLTAERGQEADAVRAVLTRDYVRPGRAIPACLGQGSDGTACRERRPAARRQQRHREAAAEDPARQL